MLRDENASSASSDDLQKEEMAIRMTVFIILMEMDIKLVISKHEMAVPKQIKAPVLKEAEVWFSPECQDVLYCVVEIIDLIISN